MTAQRNDAFSFRWGIPLLDNGQTHVPNFMLDHWHKTPVTRTEFLVIIHLARYRYERPDSESRPSVGTVAKQLGYESNRGLQMVLASLEEKSMLSRHFRSGKPTIYDFSGFSQAVLEAAMDEEQAKGHKNKRSGGEETFIPCDQRDEETFTPGVKKPSPKEEKIRKGHGHDQEYSFSPDPEPEQTKRTEELKALWRSCLRELRLQVTQVTYERWFAQTRLASFDSAAGTAVIETPDPYAVEWLRERLHAPIARTLAGISGVDVEISYILAGEKQPEPRPPPPGKRIVVTLPENASPGHAPVNPLPDANPRGRDPPILTRVGGRVQISEDSC